MVPNLFMNRRLLLHEQQEQRLAVGRQLSESGREQVEEALWVLRGLASRMDLEGLGRGWQLPQRPQQRQSRDLQLSAFGGQQHMRSLRWPRSSSV